MNPWSDPVVPVISSAFHRKRLLSKSTLSPRRKATLRESIISPDHSGSAPFGILGMTKNGRLSSTIKNPTPGVWEIVLYGNNFVFFPEQIDSKPLSACQRN